MNTEHKILSSDDTTQNSITGTVVPTFWFTEKCARFNRITYIACFNYFFVCYVHPAV